MHKIESNPAKTLLAIITGLLIIYFFAKINILLNIILGLCLIGIFSYYLSKKIEDIWFKIAFILGLIIPNIILGLIFYFFLFPIALLSKLSTKDPLSLKNNSKSMYKEVNKSFNKDSFKNTW
tara:strand:+ start:150 stop:515 length:366 start_codon:yes stop_codon:yes gene_type:complete